MRCFVALRLDQLFKAELADWLRGARRFEELAVTPVENLHLTLEFLGDIDDERVSAAGQAVEDTGSSLQSQEQRFVTWSAPGMFPTPRRPRVLWLGVDDKNGWLEAAHAELGRQLSSRGLPVEDRPYRPHLTLARVRSQVARDRVDDLLAYLNSTPVPGPSGITGVVLYQSRLGRPHAVHEPILQVAII